MWHLPRLGIQPCVPCIGRQILNNWTTREVLSSNLNKSKCFSCGMDLLNSLETRGFGVCRASLTVIFIHSPLLCLWFYLISLSLSPLFIFCSVQLLNCVHLLVTPCSAACQASLSFTKSWSLLKLMSIQSMMPSNRLILCHPLLLPSVFPSIRVFSNESVLPIR